jgi:AcrR family transcriptional regulator
MLCRQVTAPIQQPKNERSARTRAAILAAAWRLLETAGPERTTMAAVATAAGVSRRGLYLHFADRTDLLVGVRRFVDEHYDVTASTRAVWTAADAASALNEWARHLTEYHARIRGLVQAIDLARRTDDAASTMWDDAMRRWRHACTSLAERIDAAGALADRWTIGSAADVLFSYMVAFNALWEALAIESGWTPGQFQDHLATTFATLLLTTRQVDQQPGLK